MMAYSYGRERREMLRAQIQGRAIAAACFVGFVLCGVLPW